MSTKHLLIVAAIAVVAIVFVTWLALPDMGKDTTDPEGDWILVDEAYGEYRGGDIYYSHSDRTERMSISKCAGSEFSYLMESGDSKSLWVRDGDRMMTSDYYDDGDNNCAFMTIEKDVLHVTLACSTTATAMTFVREGASHSNLPEYDPIPSLMTPGTSLDAVSVLLITDEVEDLTSDNYKFVVDRAESEMFFYRVVNDVSETRYFICVYCGHDMFVSTASYDARNYLFDFLRISDGVVYVQSYDDVGGNRYWKAVYGDASKVEQIDFDLSEYTYYGKEYATKLEDNVVSVSDTTDVRLNVLWQFNDQIFIYTKTSESTSANWGGLIHKVKDGYESIVQAVIFLDDYEYLGVYIVHFSKDQKTITVYGTVGGLDSENYAFMQKYDERQIIHHYG